MSSFRLGLVQLAVGANKLSNLERVTEKVAEASKNGAQVVSLPECFNSPYGTKFFPEYAEPVPDGQSCQVLSEAAKTNKIFLVGGSIPEIDGNKLYNTCTIWNPDGKLIGKHRKMHLFDIDVPGKIKFKESDALTGGDDFTSFETPWTNIGIGICYDIRFADLAQIYARENSCELLIYPGAFNMTTGPAHWELLCKARALDNQVYCATVSPARDETAEYVAWGHSTLVNPWGDIVVKAGHQEEIVYAEIDLSKMQEVRQQIPLTNQRRFDLYKTIKV